MALAEALGELLEGRGTQAEIAARLTAAGVTTEQGAPIRQTNVSKWLRGASPLRLGTLRAIEGAYGKPRGWVLWRAGYVDLEGLDAALRQSNEDDGSSVRRRRDAAKRKAALAVPDATPRALRRPPSRRPDRKA